ncbi:solute carrier family 35 member G1-like protein [Dinothrombium tinctorium]|uniref:Solute carrier family 35 member G1-like protein n=1 Tax=Dinothrombium tinctorium TaxID=1965070 RepID=A0A3S3Q618_9ACAR|nr:solute carrier family 35 member G1-like protein [Dinothrombium tinctorium]RWS04084.1 solute carrier family 35 member G1-like protein [Dinothrombium tinctorium]
MGSDQLKDKRTSAIEKKVDDVVKQKQKAKRSYVNRMRKVPCLGIFFALMYAFCMSTAVAIVKFIHGIHPIEILVMRSIMQAIVFLALSMKKGAPLLGTLNERWHLFGRAITGTLNQGGWYLSVRKISLMDSSAIFYSAPVFVGFLAFLFLGEPFGIFEGISIVVTIVGVLLISRPQFIPIFSDKTHPMTSETIEGLILALLGSFTFALSNIHLRKLQKTATEVIAFWFSILTIFLGTILVLCFDEVKMPKDAFQWFLIFLVGLCGILGQISFALALKIEKAGPVSIVQSSNIVIVLIYQLTFFNEPVTLLSLVGAVLIGSSVVLTGLKDMLVKNHFVENIKNITTRTVSWQIDHSSKDNDLYLEKYSSFFANNISNTLKGVHGA